MRRLLAPLLCLLLLAVTGLPVTAQQGPGAPAPIPERRLIPEKDTDFYGADLRALFDTSYDACRTACLADTACGAFTFNARSNACFPKRGVERREPYEGAQSATVVSETPDRIALSRSRAAELAFLRPGDLSSARDFAEGMASLHSPAGWTLDRLQSGALEAFRNGNAREAMIWMGPAVVLADRDDQWIDYARYALDATGENSSQKRQYDRRALMGTINGYLRADTPSEQASALKVMSSALERAGRGRDMIPALRLAQATLPEPETQAALDDALGKYGFRVTDDQVDPNPVVPRVCATFSERLAESGTDYAPYVSLPGTSFTAEASGNQLCIEGLVHGERYRVVLRAGLPSATGEKMAKDVELSFYVRDRAAQVRFPGRAYVLPKTTDAAIPIVTVNTEEVDLTLHRVSDRNLLRVIQESYFGRPLNEWEEDYFEGDIAETVWEGTGHMERRLNEDVTTRLPMAEAIADLPAGVYALKAAIRGADPYENPAATQWFVISDIGLASMSGADGLHVFTRSLTTADPIEGLSVTLLSRSNRELGQATTDAQGYAKFEPGLTLGRGGAAPAMVLVKNGEEDMGFLSLTDPSFDLSDRGVEGREPAGAVDAFLTTDRGAYRAGETIYATALVRDAKAEAVQGLPLTAILTRPDGVEYARHFSAEGVDGGHVFSMPVSGAAPRGAWSLALHADPKAPPIATTTVLVEDFLPERIDFSIEVPTEGLTDGEVVADIEVRYLFGAPGAGLPVEGELRISPRRQLDGFAGYHFGTHNSGARPQTSYLNSTTTDDEGMAQLALDMPGEMEAFDGPIEARLTVRVAEGSGRPVERREAVVTGPGKPMIGIKPAFEGVVPEGTEAAFSVIAVDADLAPTEMAVKWTLNRVTRRYQWYSEYGAWNWEPITRRERIATGEGRLGETPLQVAGLVEWGNYELVVERVDGAFTAASYEFYAGWYAPADVSSTPDTLDVSLDAENYKPGDTATLRIVPRYSGKALVTVVSNRLIDMKTVDVEAETDTLVQLPVTDDWGAGAYVSATVIRPMDVSDKRGPARALGLSHASVDPGVHQLAVAIEAPAEIRPRGPLDVAVKVDGVQPGETAHVTIAAVDQGILNLTGFTPPDPSGHYFGQRRLGMGMRDIYGRLIDGMNGAMGEIRSGGDANANAGTQSPPPTEELVAYFSGPLEVGADGYARTSFDMPSFNGSVKVMAVAWSKTGVGEASADVLVRDPIVLQASLPRFMAPGDEGRLLLEITHASGETGQIGLAVTGSGVTLPSGGASTMELAEGQTIRLPLTVVAGDPGLAQINVALTTPSGEVLDKPLNLPIQLNDPEVSRTSRFELASGQSFSFTRDVFTGLQPGTGKATLALGPLGRFDVPGLLASLDRYPYGCTEQTTSRAMPLLYFDEVSRAMGLEERGDTRQRVEGAITRILARQSASGGFGLWYANSDRDFWLDAYVTDFLSRARGKGYEVPAIAFRNALDNLRNQVNYQPDFDEGGEAIAYALMVLAREGAASMGDLRYYADVKPQAFTTPLGAAQLGTALSLYGDPTRADAMFTRAAAQLVAQTGKEPGTGWRDDYGTDLRDAAAVLALAAEAGSQVVNREALSVRVTGETGHRSTQEKVWTLMAAKALIDAAPRDGFTRNGQPVTGPLVEVLADETAAQPVEIRNDSGAATTLTLTTFGVPSEPEPAGGNGYAIERQYYTMEGFGVDLGAVPAGERMVVVLTVTPFGNREARLMVDDALPAGFEIDNPSLIRSGDIRELDWLKTTSAEHSEFRQERFLSAVNWRSDKPFRLAYIVRAISPGSYHHPAASVEDMYRPAFRARTDAGGVTVVE
ncbi:alpha-2-macroglobulin family protein [Vannielia litorea]|uniref:alpha-2-macroglobulin family protein n=1 Tax=Vannielia litorea TaxID=1217970 RepID=UPI001C971FB0|nr:alpha-2-macroglobulin family protein [Vannielia litorea]MBY6049779.1 alpha-2-macroglobulin family protein [Vannielia litorea]MBY6077193.1 alpha-2-macroglobulin family protein [Vannielia litorea]